MKDWGWVTWILSALAIVLVVLTYWRGRGSRDLARRADQRAERAEHRAEEALYTAEQNEQLRRARSVSTSPPVADNTRLVFVTVFNDLDEPITEVRVRAFLVEDAGERLIGGWIPEPRIGPNNRKKKRVGDANEKANYFNRRPTRVELEFTDVNSCQWRRVDNGEPEKVSGSDGADA